MSKYTLTEDIILKFVNLWGSKTTSELAAELDMPSARVNQIASYIRKAGFDLPKKRMNTERNILITETLNKIGFPRAVVKGR